MNTAIFNRTINCSINRTNSVERAEFAGFELRFQSLFVEGRGLSFPCDAEGRVDIDGLSEKLRLNYLYARTLIGHEFTTPTVRPVMLH
jgi:hypothetical protein